MKKKITAKKLKAFAIVEKNQDKKHGDPFQLSHLAVSKEEFE